MSNFPPPVQKFDGCPSFKHFEIQTLELVLVAVADFVRTVLSQKVGGMSMSDRLAYPCRQLLVLSAVLLMHSEVSERREVAQ